MLLACQRPVWASNEIRSQDLSVRRSGKSGEATRTTPQQRKDPRNKKPFFFRNETARHTPASSIPTPSVIIKVPVPTRCMKPTIRSIFVISASQGCIRSVRLWLLVTTWLVVVVGTLPFVNSFISVVTTKKYIATTEIATTTITTTTAGKKLIFMVVASSGSSSSSSSSNRNSKNPDDAMTNSAPLYITVGPQSCGKTTFLKQLQQRDPNYKQRPPLVDISLDDQPNVYIPVPTWLFLNPNLTNTNTNTTTTNNNNNEGDAGGKASAASFLQTVHYGKSLLERIQQDNTELNLVLQRICHESLSAQTFASALLQFYQQQGYSPSIAKTLIRAVEEFVNDNNNNNKSGMDRAVAKMPSHIQVFVLEALFRPHPETQQSAIQRAHQLLRTTPLHIPVAWGNTNSRPRDYQVALEIAHQTRRPVHFIVWAAAEPSSLTSPPPSSSSPSTSTTTSTLLRPRVSLETLFRRNLERVVTSGKYVPAVAIQECCDRIEQLVSVGASASQCEEDVGRCNDISDLSSFFALEQYLVQLAEPPRSSAATNNNNDNSRRPQGGKDKGNGAATAAATYRYRLTRNRLIQKEDRPVVDDQSCLSQQ